MTQVAHSLGQIHGLPLPENQDRAPLKNFKNPVRDMLDEIGTHTKFLPEASLQPEAMQQIAEELIWARSYAGNYAALG